jgi:hypothetical protein
MAQGNENLFCIVTKQAARLHVMILEIKQRAAELAPPSIALQGLSTLYQIRLRI